MTTSARSLRTATLVAAAALLTASCGSGDDVTAQSVTDEAADTAGDSAETVTESESDSDPEPEPEPAESGDNSEDTADETADETAYENDDTGDDVSDDSDSAESTESGAEELFPDVVGVEAEQGEDGTWRFDVTLSSPYDSAERYADAWRVVGPDGTVYGERILLHDHAAEQPFTRSQGGIEIPDDVTEVLVEGRDQVSGWGGATITYTLP